MKHQSETPIAPGFIQGEVDATHGDADAMFLARIVAELGMPSEPPAVLIGSGQNSVAYQLGDRILRLPRHAGAERDLVREASTLRAVRPLLPVPVPDLEVRRIGGQLISLHAKIPGEPLSDLAGLTIGARKTLAADLAAFLQALHSVPIDCLEAGPAEAPSSEWHRLLAQCEDVAFPLLSPDVVTGLRERFSDFLATCDALPQCLIHGDFGTGNIIVDRDRLSGIIDFSGCGPGDPAYDFASLAAGLGDGFVDLVLEYLPADTAARERMSFYRMTFPLLDILYGVENRDPETIHAGVRAFAA
ncbi:phosphotransferase (plasmid) [Ensifer sp. PDNC004]|uniref:phosphotransferase family protein n=1 Tax=Ensifer sp. PDNC004 TaxID=2811423 RepID=UPI0019663564|nr:phosphotransferase [Ensifer sp. PDNC004]QRY70990.1 phosphotransferase [Ensifer sp. PDNC004]